MVLIAWSVKAADATGRAPMTVRAILSALIPAAIWGGELLGEWLNGATENPW